MNLPTFDRQIFYHPFTLPFLLSLSFLTKTILLLVLGVFEFTDGNTYVEIARDVYENSFLFPDHVLTDAPGTPYHFALFAPLEPWLGLHAYSLCNILFATANIWLIYQISLEIFHDRHNAILAATIATCYPFFNFYAITTLTETIYIFWCYAAFLVFIRFIQTQHLRWLFLFSALFAISALTRFVNLGMLPFFIILAIFIHMRHNGFTLFPLLKIIFSITIPFILLFSLWWIRNYHVHGKFVSTSLGYSGQVFYAGNNPLNQSGGGIKDVDVDFTPFEQITDLDERDAAMWRAALTWIEENPVDWLILECKKLWRFYRLTLYTPYFQAWYYDLLSLGSYGVIFILFWWGLRVHQNRWELFSPMALFMLLLTGVHLVFIASVRYRLPVEPFMIILASGAIQHLFQACMLRRK